MTKLQTISSQLWTLTNELETNTDTTESKNYILAFLCYRYLSEQQEQYLVSSSAINVKKDQAINEAYLEQAGGVELNAYLKDIFSNLGYAIAPLDTWQSLVNKIDKGQVNLSDYQTIFDNFDKNAALSKAAGQTFKGIFSNLNLGDSYLGSSANERVKSLAKIVKLVDSIDYQDEAGKDILGDISTGLISKYTAGKKGATFCTPPAVAKLIAKIVTADLPKATQSFTVYDPSCGVGSILSAVANDNNSAIAKLYGQEANLTAYNLARINLMLHHVLFTNMTLFNTDALENDWPAEPNTKEIAHPRTFDAVVANPPYPQSWNNNQNKLTDPRFRNYGKLAPRTKASFAFVLQGLYHLNEKGIMAIVLPNEVLFRSAAEATIRKNLVEHPDGNQIDAVIGLPPNLFYEGIRPMIILVLKKMRTSKDILFIDASKEFAKGKMKNYLTQENIDKIFKTYQKRVAMPQYAYLASIEEIRANDYNLNVSQYITTSENKKIDLTEIDRLLVQDKKDIAALEAKIAKDLKVLEIKRDQ
ncbi:type I restriction-modification system subunit M [Lactobacillus sp. ESL0233]|uniref:type I restriction-modification system subunit M n=1 Tax=Lactobacillus sp. ESL0233 TaxID=2069354 RepID=UPI000EFCE426|nr:type I restriction-modification system subunit M [Lactobacillus sp. ESL0233]RMC41482.1 type I restriction-modification system subunit M [Lactobacillus sp. ESL0233]